MPLSAHAQLASDSIAPDKAPRFAGNEEPIYIGVPGAARVTYASVGPLRHGTVSGGSGLGRYPRGYAPSPSAVLGMATEEHSQRR